MDVGYKFFFFIVFMSLVSMATAYLAYALVLRFWGREGLKAKIGQFVLVPGFIVLYNMLIIQSVSSGYHRYVGSVPILIIGCVAIYYYFVKGTIIGQEPEESKKVEYYNPDGEKKRSKKSERIHEARRKRGRE